MNTYSTMQRASIQGAGFRWSTIFLMICMVLTGAELKLAAQSAEGTEGLRFGLFGNGGLVNHTSDFQEIPGTESCCLSFTGGSGFGIGGGGLIELPIGSFLIGGRLGYMSYPFDMTTEEGTFLIVGGNGEEGAFEHRLSGSYATVGFEPTIGLRLFDRLIIGAGLRAGLPISSNYEQYEQLTQPSGSGTFLNADGTDSQQRTRNTYQGSLPDPNIQIAPLAGISYELPMNADNTLLLAPEVSYEMGASNVIAGVDWKTNVLRLGLAVKFTSRSQEIHREERRLVDTVEWEVPILAQNYARGEEQRVERREMLDGEEVVVETIRRTDTIFVKRPEVIQPAPSSIAAAIHATSVSADGVERPVARITVEEFSSTLMTPLLPYIFFDENSASIPERYARLNPAETSTFDIDEINVPETMVPYYHLMDIVARRMQEHPSARITLTGTNQNRDGEKGNTTLSRNRAEQVKSYLVDVWKLDESRIDVRGRNLPEKAANTMTEDGAAENRRVEIASNDPEILFPIITRDTLRRVDPPLIRFHPSVVADQPTGDWNVKAAQEQRELKGFKGTGNLPAILEWNIERQVATIPRTSSPVVYTLDAEDNEGKMAAAQGTIEVEQITIRKKQQEMIDDYVVDRFSLILFDVRSSELNELHEPIIRLIREYIKPASRVKVTGYTDRLGNSDYNQKLAEQRAATVAKALGGTSMTSEGIGEADLYNSDLPEARLYTRTVEVVVETPVE